MTTTAPTISELANLGSPRVGQPLTLAYVSEIDGSRQAYVLYLPKGYENDGKRKWPIVFFGVGYGGKAGPPPCQDWADRNGWVFACFDGRQTLHYNGVAERDFDQLLHRELATRLSLDLTRVFFIGGSQGASGAFGFGFRRPDWFASVGGSGGFVDVDEWYPRWHGPPDKHGRWPEKYNGPAWRLPAALAFSVVDSAEHGYWLNPWVHVGEKDEINRQFALRKLSARLSELGVSHVYEETCGGGHCAGFDTTAVLEHFRTRCRPTDPLRPKVWISTNRLEFARVGWAAVDSLFGRDKPAKLLAVIEPPDAIRVTAGPLVRSATLDISKELLAANKIDSAKPLRLLVDGAEFKLDAGEAGAVHLVRASPAGRWELAKGPQVLGKRAGLEGPANHVFETPFIIAYGTAGDEAATARNRKLAEALANQYVHLQNGEVKPVAEGDCTEEVLGRRSVVLVGSEETSGLIARCAKAPGWPYVASEKEVGVRGVAGGVFPAGENMLYAIYPSPWAKDRYVVVLSGGNELPSLGLGWRAPFWLPDYTVFTKADPKAEEEDVRLAGYLDEDWRVAEGK